MISTEKYVVVTPFFPSKNSFVGSYIYDQIRELNNQLNFEFVIIKLVSMFSKEIDYKFKEYKVFIFKVYDFPSFILPGIFNKFNKKRFNNFLHRRKINNIKFLHGHVSYPAAYLISEFQTHKFIQHHGLDVLQLKNGRIRFIRTLQRSFLINNSINHLNKIDLNIGVSKKVLNELNQYSNYKPIKETVLYNGVNTSKFFNLEKHKNEIFTIGCVANFWKIKDHITLIKSVEFLYHQGIDVKVRIIGSGATLKKCQKYVNSKFLTHIFKFEKELPHELLNDFYNQIDIFVLPSYYEAFGCVYLESWATNTPFIAVNKQGISELLSDEYKESLLIAKSDYLDLAKKIIHLYENPLDFKFDDNFEISKLISDFKQKFLL